MFDGRTVRLSQRSGAVEVEGLRGSRSLQRLARYLAIDQPLGAIERALASDRVLARILPETSGIAILRQDPWQCLTGFVISAFNNIPKIELTLERLSRRFGPPLPGGAYGFPPAGALARASERALRSCLLGYRAPYLLELARRVDSGTLALESLVALPYDEAKRVLQELPGVGEKVADCVLLFAYGKGEAFPVDVWVKRAVERWYFGGAARTPGEIRGFARRRFGELAGWAQQHLFHYIRMRRRRDGARAIGRRESHRL